MYAKIHRTMDRLFYPLHNSIAWISKTMEELQHKLEYTKWIIQRQQDYITRGEEAIKSFVGTWFKMSREDVDICFPTSSHLPPYQSNNLQNIKLNDNNKALNRRQPIGKFYLSFHCQFYLFSCFLCFRKKVSKETIALSIDR